MAVDFETLRSVVRERFTDQVLDWTGFRGQACLHVRRERIVEILRFLRDEPSARFAMLSDVTALDFLKHPDADRLPERFAVVYQLLSLEHNERLRVRAYVPEEPCEIASAVEIWPAANWGEREVFDMFGIRFTGHPDLRRILMPDTYKGHPLRKDYPLKGRGERDNFPKYTEIPEEGVRGGHQA